MQASAWCARPGKLGHQAVKLTRVLNPARTQRVHNITTITNNRSYKHRNIRRTPPDPQYSFKPHNKSQQSASKTNTTRISSKARLLQSASVQGEPSRKLQTQCSDRNDASKTDPRTVLQDGRRSVHPDRGLSVLRRESTKQTGSPKRQHGNATLGAATKKTSGSRTVSESDSTKKIVQDKNYHTLPATATTDETATGQPQDSDESRKLATGRPSSSETEVQGHLYRQVRQTW